MGWYLPAGHPHTAPGLPFSTPGTKEVMTLAGGLTILSYNSDPALLGVPLLPNFHLAYFLESQPLRILPSTSLGGRKVVSPHPPCVPIPMVDKRAVPRAVWAGGSCPCRHWYRDHLLGPLLLWSELHFHKHRAEHVRWPLWLQRVPWPPPAQPLWREEMGGSRRLGPALLSV